MELVLDRAQVVVVGGGTVGVSTAFFLREMGYDVVLVEREHVAWGASGRNAGFLMIMHRNAGIPLEMARMGIRLLQDMSAELGRTFEMRIEGGIMFFETDEQRRVFEEFAAGRREDGVGVEIIDERQARELCPMLPESAIGAAYCAEDGQIRSRWFVEALANACVRRGVRLHERTAVTGLLRGDEGSIGGVRTADGVVTAEAVVWATGAWSGQLESEGVVVPVRPERLGVLMTAPIPDRMNVTLNGPLNAKQYENFRRLPSFKDEYFVADWESPAEGYEYLEVAVQREDGCLQVGNPEDYHDSFDIETPLVGLKAMVDSLLRRWPHLKGVGVRDFWSGLLPVTPDAMPIVGPVEDIPGLYIGAGHVFGNTAGPTTGKLLAELVAGREPSLPVDELSLSRPSLYQQVEGMTRW